MPSAASPSLGSESVLGAGGAFGARLRWLAPFFLVALLVGAALRVVLYAAFRATPFDPGQLLWSLVEGALVDLPTLMLALAPLSIVLTLLRLRWLALPAVHVLLLWLYSSAIVFEAATEYYFFEEFNARYNHIALDYLLYPTEVFGNVRDSYDVPLVVALSIAAGALLAWTLGRPRRARGAKHAFGPLPWRTRARGAATLAGCLGVAGLTLSMLPAALSSDRIVAEIRENGLVQLVRAFRTASLDYDLYYPTLPADESRSTAARYLGFEAPAPDELALPRGSFDWTRTIEPAQRTTPIGRPYDAVVILEESLGCDFVESLGHASRPSCPQLDRWLERGLALSNLVATGNRTVRGLEGTLCSFVPLPGDSIVKRSRSEDVACLARVFRAAGFSSEFFYGGRGLFDNMRSFFLANGYERFFEQSDFPGDPFSTIWGVADEYAFDALLRRQLEAAEHGEPLFATMLSVSNHRPYDHPAGRIEGGKTTGRVGAVRYADWALGRYLDALEEHGLLEHTVVLVVGDHGPRVYGSEEIPVESYRIPGLFLSPDARWQHARIERLCSQIDLAPTLLSLCGVRTSTPFLGQDLLGLPAEGGRAFVQHNRDIGLLTDRALVALGLQGKRVFYRRSGRDDDTLERVDDDAIPAELLEEERLATAVFQTADELYEARRYRLPADLEPRGVARTP